MEQVVIDSTMQEENITHPTFARLDAKIAEGCCCMAEREGVVLGQAYPRTLPKLRIRARTHRHKNPTIRAWALCRGPPAPGKDITPRLRVGL